MALPFFYIQDYNPSQKEILLDEDTSHHIVQVLRMKEGEMLNLTDGRGTLITAEINHAHKKRCEVIVIDSRFTSHDSRRITIAISLLKNTSRFEWFLEKATEIGVTEIIPLICERTEKQKFRLERMQQICISAMLQSHQCWLTLLHQPLKYEHFISRKEPASTEQKFIAYCAETSDKKPLSIFKPFNPGIILIGPEGDFTHEEVRHALERGFVPVSLGETRLRSETAGMVAAVLLMLG